MKDGFFAVDRKKFIEACELGLNPAASFIVMACGTGRDHVTTAWSANAIENYAGIRWSRARDAIRLLESASLVSTTTIGKRPRYRLATGNEPIWIPNAAVAGVGNETPPLAKLRQAQCKMTLRLFVELYHAQNLRDDGGISRGVTYQAYDRHELGGRGANTVWTFDAGNQYVTWGDVTEPHKREKLSKEEKAQGRNAGIDFFARWETLSRLGLVEWCPYLFEGAEGEAIHPLQGDKLLDAMRTAAEGMLSEGQVARMENYDFAIPVPNHMQQVQVYGVARLRYRPHTKLTGAWWQQHNQQVIDATNRYRTLSGTDQGVDIKGYQGISR